jgi:hypothetical protein
LVFIIRLQSHGGSWQAGDKTDDARCIEPVAIDRDFFERQWWGDEGKS